MLGKFTWALGPSIEVPANGWTSVRWAPVFNTDSLTLEGGTVWALGAAGLWSWMLTLAWEANAAHMTPFVLDARIRQLNPAGSWDPVAAASLPVPSCVPGDRFYQQVMLQPGAVDANGRLDVQVRSTVGMALVADGFLAPSLMSAYLMDLTP